MKTLMIFAIVTALIGGMDNLSDATVIDFDDIEGMPAGLVRSGECIPSNYIIDDEYLSQGVLFGSEGGGIRVARAGNAISWPNLVSGTAPGPTLDYMAPVYASFWIDEAPGLVDSAGLMISNFNGSGALEAYDRGGTLLGSVSENGVARLSLTFPGQIHAVIFKPNHAVFDNFTFDGLRAVPIPGAAWLLGSGWIGLLGMRRIVKKFVP